MTCHDPDKSEWCKNVQCIIGNKCIKSLSYSISVVKFSGLKQVFWSWWHHSGVSVKKTETDSATEYDIKIN